MDKQKSSPFKRFDIFILLFILIISFALRLYKINTPLADLHSWRQVDTAAVARNFVRGGFDLFHPRYDDLSSLQSGKENPQGYRFVEFPIYNAIFAGFYKLLPVFSIEVYGRLTSIIFSLFIIISLYYLALKERGRIAAIAASLVYGVFPFFVFFSRTVLPETTAVSLAIISILLLYVSINDKKTAPSMVLLFTSAILFTLSLLIKPTTIFYSIALMYIFVKRYEIQLVKYIPFYLYFLVVFVPFLLWRVYIQNFPEGIPASSWLIAYVNTSEGQKNIFFRPAFFRWVFFERINNMMFGGYLSALFLIGFLGKWKNFILHSIVLSAFAYLFVFQGGNVQHEYYQIIILPAFALFVGVGVELILKNTKYIFNAFLSWCIIFVIFGLSWFFSYYNVKGFYDYPEELPRIASIIKTLTQPTDKIITDRQGDTTLLYLADRKGTPAVYKSMEDFKNEGYSYVVTADQGLIQQLSSNENYYKVFESDRFWIFRL